ncbi:MAG TPA: replication protein RepA [Anaeromyxobacteraceae bacterium]|jgi:hypothetical protein|nr:replication protein RepA [Anaeromyxobacteraceae bacterium]
MAAQSLASLVAPSGGRLDARCSDRGDARHPVALSNANLRRIVDNGLQVAAVDAASADSIGYLARILVLTNLPHRDPGDILAWTRRNGDFTLQITPGVAPATAVEPARRLGIPYGTYPRLVLSWVTTEVLRTRSPELVLGQSLAEFLRRLGVHRTGGEQGTIGRVREQLRRLFAATISWTYQRGNVQLEAGVRPFEGVFTFWDPTRPHQDAVFPSRLVLNQRLFEEILRSSVPFDLRVVRELARQHNCLGIDLYGWLTHKQFQLARTGRSALVPWTSLAQQFGGDYGRTRDFKRRFLAALTVVERLYPGAMAVPQARGLFIRPGATAVAARRTELVG